MTDSWDEMRRAKEEAFFKKQNDEAVKRIQQREGDKPRLSPITGKPMEQLTIMGVVVDRCNDSGGIWLDGGELEQILHNSKENPEAKEAGFMDSFLGVLLKKK